MELAKHYVVDEQGRRVAGVPTGCRAEVERFAFGVLPTTGSLEELGNVERMKGHAGYYRVGFGEYRIGLSLSAGVVTCERVLHRRNIYRFFP